ncbi:hypothetical protein [Streptomyces sulphureus]|uniref:hypothetical protein n=1 Tax=Streptomyces sulphureus TaxID=47758 RepID=UPI000364CB95|nr:hypothetical protein [Streptomyces sulphureus]
MRAPITVARATLLVTAGEWPDARAFRPHAEDGEFLGYTFQVGELHSARYGWITASGAAYARGLEAYRSHAADVLRHAVRDEAKRGER